MTNREWGCLYMGMALGALAILVGYALGGLV
jgi:hypothetical protein